MHGMKRHIFWAVLLGGCTAHVTPTAAPDATTVAIAFSFDTGELGSLPRSWRVDATKPASPIASWSLVDDASAPSGGRALALDASEHGSDGTFNLCWTDSAFRDGTIHVAFKARAGLVDQGGGPIWRALDADNYYICRANPLEGNFRLYKVVAGKRKQLASAALGIASDTWHTIDVEHIGERIVCSLNGAELLEVTDTTFPGAGGIGLWTKADALTSFDELRIRP